MENISMHYGLLLGSELIRVIVRKNSGHTTTFEM